MKKSLIVLGIAALLTLGLISCSTQKGCQATKGYVGYGK